MNRERLEQFIKESIGIASEGARQVAVTFEFTEVKKHDIIIEENKIAAETFLLQEGYIRSFVLNREGEEITTNIYAPFCFVNDMLSFFKRSPSQEYFQAMSDCQLWKINYAELQKNFHGLPEFREFGRMMLVKNYASLKERMLGMIKNTAEERYLQLLHQHPHIFQQVPLKVIASYLGITDTSLSRIRKELTKK